MPLHLDGYYMRKMPALQWNEERQCYLVQGSEGDSKEGQWMFFFLDLVFLSLLLKLTNVLTQCAISFHSLAFVSILLAVLFITRLHLDDYQNRFYVNDLFHRLCYFVYVCVMFVMALNINAANTDGLASDALCDANLYGIGFAVAFITSRLVLLALYSSVVLESPSTAFSQFIGPIIRTLISTYLVICLVAAEQFNMEKRLHHSDFSPAYRMYIYLIALVVEGSFSMLQHVLKGLKKSGCWVWDGLAGTEHYQLDVQVYEERLGSFLLMVLGAAIVVILTPYFDVQNSIETYQYNLIAMCIIFFLGLEYFDAASAPSAPAAIIDAEMAEKAKAAAEAAAEAGAASSDGTKLLASSTTTSSTSSSTTSMAPSSSSSSSPPHAMTTSIFTSFAYTWIHLFIALGFFFTSSSVAILFQQSTYLLPTIVEAQLAEPLTDDGKYRVRTTKTNKHQQQQQQQ